MHRRKHAPQHPTTRQRLLYALGVGVVLAALPVSFAGPVQMPPIAHAQQPDRATQVLFLAVAKNDLPGVQAAINGGADIHARDFNGMQAVDLAIERGYFDIAHYLISVRNQVEAQGGTAKIAPTPEQLAQMQPPTPEPTSEPSVAPAPEIPPGTPNPFDAPRVSDGLPVIGDVREPAQTEVAEAPETVSAPDTVAAKPSATKTFVTTFLDFFRPPNTTGIMRRDTREGTDEQNALTDAELNQQLQQIEAERGDAPIKGPAVPISPDELARELPPAPEVPDDIAAPDNGFLAPSTLPPYAITSPGDAPAQRAETTGEEAFGDLAIADVTSEDAEPLAGSAPADTVPAPLDSARDPSLPFDGGVDPDILALLGREPAVNAPAQADPFAQAADPFADAAAPDAQDPFATPAQDETVASVLQGLDEPQDVAPLQTHSPPPPGGAVDPFATPAGEVDELSGLLEGIGESVASKQDGWDVKSVDGAVLPDELPLLADIAPTGEPLDGVELTLGTDTAIGKPVGEERLKLLAEETIHKPCLQKGGPQTVFCVDKITWPFELEENFLVDTIMYQGTRAISRYDAGHASHYHTLFNTGAFAKVVNYYIGLYGPPSDKIERAIAPLGQPRRDNPTYIWRSREPGTDTITILEIREFDDARGSFPDTRRGVVLLYRDHAGGIFPLLSQLELMVLKDSGALDLTPKTPDNVW